MSLLLAVASVSWWFGASRARLVVSVRTVHATQTPVAVSDCPSNAACRPDAAVRPAVLALVRARFGPDSITGSSAVVNLRSGARYAEFVAARVAPGVEIQLATRCVNGSATPTSVAPTSVPSHGPASLVAVVAGRDGCSVAVAMQVGRGIAVPWARASDLVHTPSLQLEN